MNDLPQVYGLPGETHLGPDFPADVGADVVQEVWNLELRAHYLRRNLLVDAARVTSDARLPLIVLRAYPERGLVPTWVLTDDGRLRDDVAAVLDVLRAGGWSDWDMLVWLDIPTNWLSGDVPRELLDKGELTRVVHAASRLG